MPGCEVVVMRIGPDQGAQTPPAERRLPMPPRTCQGFRRVCTTLLSAYNQESVCSCCSRRRGDASIEAANEHKARRHVGFCSNGHEWTSENTRIGGDGHRRCRMCIAASRWRGGS